MEMENKMDYNKFFKLCDKIEQRLSKKKHLSNLELVLKKEIRFLFSKESKIRKILAHAYWKKVLGEKEYNRIIKEELDNLKKKQAA